MRHRGFVHDLWDTFVYESKLDFESLHSIFSPQAFTIDPLLGMYVGPKGIQTVCKGWYDSYTNITYPKVRLLNSGENYIYFDWKIDDLYLSEEETFYSAVRKAGFDGTTLMEISEGSIVSIQYQLKSLENKLSIKRQLEVIEQQKGTLLQIIGWRESLTHLEALVVSCYLTGRSFLYTERLLGLPRKKSQTILDRQLSSLGIRTRKALFDHFTMRQSVHLFYRLFELQKNSFILARIQKVQAKSKKPKRLTLLKDH